MKVENALLDATLTSWRSTMDRTGKFFGGLNDTALQAEIAPGKNRLIYIWGHLIAVNDLMIPLLRFGDRYYSELDDIFLKNPDHAVAHELNAAQLSEMWRRTDETLWNNFGKLTPAEWLERHQSVSPEEFEKQPHRNRFSVLLSRLGHLSQHLGQVVLANHS
jgi:hypothetical protein